MIPVVHVHHASRDRTGQRTAEEGGRAADIAGVDRVFAERRFVGGELIGRGEVAPRGTGSYAEGPVFWEVCIGGAEVAIDPETGRVTLNKIASVADVGKALNPRQVEAQEMGGAMQGIGNALRVWDGWAHDWPWWREMIQVYIAGT